MSAYREGEDAAVIGLPFVLERNSRKTGFARNASRPTVTRESTSSLLSLKRVGIELSVDARLEGEDGADDSQQRRHIIKLI
jgi:hypothetical protein